VGKTTTAGNLLAFSASCQKAQMIATVRHYLRVADDHYRQAAQNAAQKLHEMTGNEQETATNSEDATSGASGILRKTRLPSRPKESQVLGDTGLEPPKRTRRKSRLVRLGDTGLEPVTSRV
jgi:hypothetical protein